MENKSAVQPAWRPPTPSPALMRFVAIANRWFLMRGLPLLRHIPGVRDLPLIRGYFRIRNIEILSTHWHRLHQAVNRHTVAFLGPNHPEFGTDWMIDKEISTFCAPHMASWAERGIVASAPRFFSMNNLVANDGGDAAKDYSIRWATAGNGVLLHPEGTVRWTNDHVHPLFPGIAQMAIKAAAETDKPVYIVPLVWKYRYIRDVSRGIHREIRILEQGLALPSTNGQSIPQRFFALQTNILAMQMQRFGYEQGSIDGTNALNGNTNANATSHFFDRQRAFQHWLIHTLAHRHPTDTADHDDKQIARHARTIRAKLADLKHEADTGSPELRAQLKHDLAMADEAKRLGEFSQMIYGTPTLTQEQLFESLKRARDRLLNRRSADKLANMLPRPLGPRIVHVGIPEPIPVERVNEDRAKAYENVLLDLTRQRMQAALDEINARIEPEVAPFRCDNPFATL